MPKSLQVYLTKVEYVVFFDLSSRLKLRGNWGAFGLESKVVDNAKTSARQKLQKIIRQYGSLSNPQIPLQTRKRVDLAMEVKVI